MSFYLDKIEFELGCLKSFRYSYFVDAKDLRKAGFSASQIQEFNNLFFDKKNMEALH